METVLTSSVRIITTTALPELGRKSTKECFIPPRYTYCDIDLLICLPEFQPESGPCTVTTLGPMENVTLREYAAALLRVPANIPLKTIEDLLRRRGYPLLLTHLDKMVVE